MSEWQKSLERIYGSLTAHVALHVVDKSWPCLNPRGERLLSYLRKRRQRT